ncbi:MAG: STAS domain-containing protein [Lachnospiraceae bacterium]|nr:STAS domain-containing protein [Lachnospiraceae bacterium]
MTFQKSADGKELTVALTGDLDSTNTPELEGKLLEEMDGVQELCFDLSGLDYVSSAGLRVFLTTQKQMAGVGKMTIRHVGEEVMGIFTVTGFSKLLHIERD